MSVLRRLTWLAFPLLSMAFNVQANTAPAQLNKAELEQRFAKLGLQVEEIKPSDINGLLEVQRLVVCCSLRLMVSTLSRVLCMRWMVMVVMLMCWLNAKRHSTPRKLPHYKTA